MRKTPIFAGWYGSHGPARPLDPTRASGSRRASARAVRPSTVGSGDGSPAPRGRFGAVFKGPGEYVTYRCALLPSQEASTAITHLSRFGGRFTEGQLASQVAGGLIWGGDILLWVDGNQATSIYMQALALMPEDGSASCIDALTL